MKKSRIYYQFDDENLDTIQKCYGGYGEVKATSFDNAIEILKTMPHESENLKNENFNFNMMNLDTNDQYRGDN